MTIVQRMRASLKDSMKARDATRTNVLRYWIAQLTLGTGEEMADADSIKKMRGVVKEAKSGQTTWTPEEIALIGRNGCPPRSASTRSGRRLAPLCDQIKAAPKDGMAMGLAMKALAGQPVDSDDVKAAVASIRA